MKIFQSKKVFLGIAVFVQMFVIGAIYKEFAQNQPVYIKVTEQKSDLWIDNQDNGLKVYITEKPFEFKYINQNTSYLEQFAQSEQFQFAINGSFFDGKYEDATHAGLLVLNNKKVSEFKEDKQLSSIMQYTTDNQGNTLNVEFYPVQEYNPNSFEIDINNAKDFTINAFQSGPMILKESIIQDVDIKNSINGEEKKKRTFIGYIHQEKKFIYGIITKPITLNDLAVIIRDDELLKDKQLSIINLDGGPSTALYSSNKNIKSYNSKKILPIIIGVK